MHISITIQAFEEGDKPPTDLDKVAEKVLKAIGGRATKDTCFVSVVGVAGATTLQTGPEVKQADPEKANVKEPSAAQEAAAAKKG